MHRSLARTFERLERARGRVEMARRPELVELSVGRTEPSLEPLSLAEVHDAGLHPTRSGQRWGPAWTNTWFRLRGRVPAGWSGRTVAVEVDLGFGPGAPGTAEGLVFCGGQPLAGVSSLAHQIPLLAAAVGGEAVDLMVLATANPFTSVDLVARGFDPTALGHPRTAGREPLNRLGSPALVAVDHEAEALAHDLDVLIELAQDLDAGDPRHHQLVRALERAMAAFDEAGPHERAGAARAELADVLATPARSSAHRIVAVGHAHLDTAWLWPIVETRRKVARTFANAVALLDRHPDARFVASQAVHYRWLWEDHPALAARVRDHVTAGRWHPAGGMWVEADVNLTGGESWVRQLAWGQRWFGEHLGRRCEEVWLPDDFGFPATLPGVARQAGLKWCFTQKLCWNETNTFPHHTFWWEGLDGSRLFTHFTPANDYNAELRSAALRAAERRFRDHGGATRSLLPFGHGDGGGGPTTAMVERGRRMADLDGVPRLGFGSPADLFAPAEAEYGDEAPVWVGELYLETHRGTYTSQRRTKSGNRRCERLLWEAELWGVLAGTWPAERLQRCWEAVLVRQFHDILPGTSIGWVHEEAEAVHCRVATELESLIGDTVATLASGHGGLVVVNPTTASVDAVVVGPCPPWLDPGPDAQPLGDGRLAVRAAAPALGIAGVSAGDLDRQSEGDEPRPFAPVEVGEGWMGNGLVRVAWDETGCLTSIYDLEEDRELVPPGRRTNVVVLHDDHPARFDAWDVDEADHARGTAVTEADAVDVVDAGPLLATVAVRRRVGASSVTQEVTLRAGSRRIDLACAVDWQEDERMLRVEIPFDLRAPSARCGVQFGHVDHPRHTNTSWEAARFEVCVHRYVELAEHGYRAAVLVDGSSGADVRGDAVRLTLLRAARFPDPDADRGCHRIRYAIVGFAGPTRAASVVETEADLFAIPPRLVDMGASGPPLPARAALTVDHPGVGVSAVKLADDGSGDLVVRLWERDGGRAGCRLGWVRPLGAAWSTDLLEEVQEPLEVSHGAVLVSLVPHQVVTVRARPA